jgi:SAM-dependent methyltransferase
LVGHLRTLRRALPRPVEPIDAQDPVPPGTIDAAERSRTISVEELARTADEYFSAQPDGVDYWHAKPFWHTSEVTDMLITFGQVLGALDLSPGMRVLDFGAGSGWTSRYLSQLGCEVIVSDVSETALDIARDLFKRVPVLGHRPEPEFLRFDGHTISLEDESIDRVLCFDALHHTPNPQVVLKEMARVLRPGGRAAFSEPGPNHSKTAQSQYEMKNYAVVENDILMRDIERWSTEAGFAELRMSVFCTAPFTVPIDGYERLLARRSEALDFLDHHRNFLMTRRVFMLRRDGTERLDSRNRAHLGGEIEVDAESLSVPPGGALTGTYRARNTGEGHWLPSGAALGPVLIGVHLYSDDGRLIDRDYARVPLPGPAGVAPNESVAGRFELPAPPTGVHTLEFDLVAEGVAWFEINGTRPARLTVSTDDK